MPTKDTKTELLDAAQAMIQERGFNAFSYKDLAEVVGIRTASIHYHFAAKTDLALALMTRYSAELESALAVIDRPGRSAQARLERFIDLYRQTAKRGAICLCGSLGADLETLPGALRDEVAAYLSRSERWVEATTKAGANEGDFSLRSGSARSFATTLVAALQGSLVMARAQGPAARALSAVKAQMLAQLENGPA